MIVLKVSASAASVINKHIQFPVHVSLHSPYCNLYCEPVCTGMYIYICALLYIPVVTGDHTQWDPNDIHYSSAVAEGLGVIQIIIWTPTPPGKNSWFPTD